MNTYRITYSGNASKFKNREWIEQGVSALSALSFIYALCAGDIFDQPDGTLKDECGNSIQYGENWIEYDGGFFNAELID